LVGRYVDMKQVVRWQPPHTAAARGDALGHRKPAGCGVVDSPAHVHNHDCTKDNNNVNV